MSSPIAELEAWAAARGLPLRPPATCTRDFGGLVTRVPALVLAPRSTGELAALVAELSARGLPFTVRGTAHTAGGQTLSEGVVIDTRGLARIVADRPDELVVEAGALWLDVVRHLYPQGRRPTALTDNLRTTVGGTLALGGFGDTSHRHGLQIAGVSALTLVTPDEGTLSCGPSDELFRYSLAGRGQLGILAEVTLRTLARPPLLTGRVLRWPSLARFLDDAARIRDEAHHEYLRARLYFHADGSHRVEALAADFVAEPRRPDPVFQLRPEHASPVDTLDLAALAELDPSLAWPPHAPCLELAFPLPDGVLVWAELHDQLRAAGLTAHLPDGASVLVVSGDPAFPLAPLAPGDNLVVALRPGFADPALAAEVAARLARLGEHAVQAGARLYPVAGGEPREETVAHWRVLKDRVDRRRLCNPWLL